LFSATHGFVLHLSFISPSWRARRQVLEMNMPCDRGFVVESLKTKSGFKRRDTGTGFESQVKFRSGDAVVELHTKSKFSRIFLINHS